MQGVSECVFVLFLNDESNVKSNLITIKIFIKYFFINIQKGTIMGEFSKESLALAIKEAGISKAELARRMKVSPQAVNEYLKGTPTLDTWNKFYIAIGKEPLKQYSAFDPLQTAPTVNEDDAPTYGQSATDYNLVGQLKELSELYKAGMLDEAEFVEAKQIVIKKFKCK